MFQSLVITNLVQKALGLVDVLICHNTYGHTTMRLAPCSVVIHHSGSALLHPTARIWPWANVLLSLICLLSNLWNLGIVAMPNILFVKNPANNFQKVDLTIRALLHQSIFIKCQQAIQEI